MDLCLNITVHFELSHSKINATQYTHGLMTWAFLDQILFCCLELSSKQFALTYFFAF